jgi:hypothetical protein
VSRGRSPSRTSRPDPAPALPGPWRAVPSASRSRS